jgi:biotin synthase-related radical SAM superfamily protein
MVDKRADSSAQQKDSKAKPLIHELPTRALDIIPSPLVTQQCTQFDRPNKKIISVLKT